MPDDPRPQRQKNAKIPDQNQDEDQDRDLPGLLGHYPGIIFLLPLIVFMVVGSFEPTPQIPGGAQFTLSIPYEAYPLVYTLKIVLTLAAMLWVLPGYRRFPLRISPLAIGVGVVGVVVWVGLCRLGWEQKYLAPNGLGWLVGTGPEDDSTEGIGERSGFNPLVEMADHPGWAYGFLAIRLIGLALVIPVVEEFFLRGFVLRMVVDQNTWWKIPFGTVAPLVIVVGTILPMLMHPGELLAAAVWFSMVTWLMVRTRNIWDCIAAHAVTNLLLGIYVIASGEWHLM